MFLLLASQFCLFQMTQSSFDLRTVLRKFLSVIWNFTVKAAAAAHPAMARVVRAY